MREMKKCCCCLRWLLLTSFSLAKGNADGLQPQCKQCATFRGRLRYQAKCAGEDPRVIDRCAREAIAVQQWSPHDQDWGRPDVRIG